MKIDLFNQHYKEDDQQILVAKNDIRHIYLKNMGAVFFHNIKYNDIYYFGSLEHYIKTKRNKND